MTSSRRAILLTGATGYIGGRLRPLLDVLGHDVRCLVRDPAAMDAAVTDRATTVRGDLLDRASLDRAMEGIDTAYFLVHSMGAGGGFEARDREAATNFASAARAAGVRRIIYLGGLGDDTTPDSTHLRSRHEVGELLRRDAGGVQIVEFRASIVIGVGSASFEMIRALVERLPVMVTPRWVSVLAQPIAIDDVLAYLVAALELPAGPHRLYEIGGNDRLSYGGIMHEYARQRGLRRVMIPVPVLTPRLSSLWLAIVAPSHARLGRYLIESLRYPTVVNDPAALRDFDIRPRGVQAAVEGAIAEGRERRLGRLVDSRTTRVGVPPVAAFNAIRRVGGENGWYYGDWLWQLRGWMDLLVGGPGMRRGRRHAEELTVGEALDCWKVDTYEPHRLVLVAEMRLPGKARLEFEVNPDGGGSVIRQTAVFEPKGVSGLAYWYAAWPLHQLVFAGMLRGIARAAEGRFTPASAG